MSATTPDLIAQVIADVKAVSGEMGRGPKPYFAARGLDYEDIKAALLAEGESLATLTAAIITNDDDELETRHFTSSMCAALVFGFAFGTEFQRRRHSPAILPS